MDKTLGEVGTVRSSIFCDDQSCLEKKESSVTSSARKIIILHEPPAEMVRRKVVGTDRNTRVIDLGDKKTKMELRREFKVDESDRTDQSVMLELPPPLGELRYCRKTMDDKGPESFVPKLPLGTVLIKHNNNVIKSSIQLSRNSNIPRFNQRTNSRSAKQVSPAKKRTPQSRRNPIRGSKKKIEDENFSRPRLLSMKRGGGMEDHLNLDKKLMKFSDVPYMNTRSVTKKLYNVGATHQAPILHDEIEWKEWPAHGMHERPIFHPQIGNAVECMGRCFTSLDNFSYQEISENPDIGIISIPTRSENRKTYSRDDQLKGRNDSSSRMIENSFENCMHDSFHTVLAFSSQIMTPQYRKIEERMQTHASKQKISIENSNETEVGKTSSSNASMMQTKTESTARALETSVLKILKPSMNLKCIKNHAKLQQVLGRGTRNTLILLKTSDPSLKKDEIKSVSDQNPILTASSTNDRNDLKEKSKNATEDHSCPEETKNSGKVHTTQTISKCEISTEKVEEENWLKELIGNTAVLYCTAAGIDQENLVNYIDTLDARQCRNWLRSGY